MNLLRATCLSTALLFSVCASHAQQTVPATATAALPQLSPKAAYDDAMHPLDETRRAISNWSAAELSALTVTLSRARAACQARNPHLYAGTDLIELARLCALGQEWGTVVLATSLYIDETAPSKPLLADAHAARVDADLHLRSEPDALRDAHAMFAAVPYSPIVAEASTEAIEYMRFSAPDDAISIANEREPFILQQLRETQGPAASSPAAAVGSANAPTQADKSAVAKGAGDPSSAAANSSPKQSLHELYGQGLALAALLQQADRAAIAQRTVAELDKALPAVLSTDDSLRIADERQRYALLGKPLPPLALNRSLSMPYILPTIPAVNTVTALLLFPDWCAQCITSVAQLPETVSAVEGHSAYYYGLLTETVPEKTPPADQSAAGALRSFQPGYAAALLADRPVVTVPTSTPAEFAANDFPFLVVTDVKGVVRVAQPVDADDLSSGGKVDAAVLLVSKHWPMPSLMAPPQGSGASEHSSSKQAVQD